MKKIEVFGCDFCKYYKKTKKSVENHEDKCFYNPKNKACASCIHNVMEYTTMYNPDNGGDPGSTDYEVKVNWCDKIDIELTHKSLRKNCALYKQK